MIQSEWGHDIELKYSYKNETVGELKTYTLTKEELEKYLNETSITYRSCGAVFVGYP